jgi:hypothetical protein
MDKTIRRFSSLAEMKAEELRDWQALSSRERIEAVSEITATAFALKGQTANVPRLQGSLVHLKRA